MTVFSILVGGDDGSCAVVVTALRFQPSPGRGEMGSKGLTGLCSLRPSFKTRCVVCDVLFFEPELRGWDSRTLMRRFTLFQVRCPHFWKTALSK